MEITWINTKFELLIKSNVTTFVTSSKCLGSDTTLTCRRGLLERRGNMTLSNSSRYMSSWFIGVPILGLMHPMAVLFMLEQGCCAIIRIIVTKLNIHTQYLLTAEELIMSFGASVTLRLCPVKVNIVPPLHCMTNKSKHFTWLIYWTGSQKNDLLMMSWYYHICN